MSDPIPATPASDIDPFDPGLASLPTRRLPIESVTDLLQITHAPDRVAEYRIKMQRGDRFPPVSVIRLAGHFLVADGHKRFTAYRALGRDEILVEVWTLRRWLGDQWRQVRTNAGKNRRILRRSVSEPAEATRLLRSTWFHWKRVAACLVGRARSSLGPSDHVEEHSLVLFGRLLREHLAFPASLCFAVLSMAVLAGAQLYLVWLVKAVVEGPLASGDRGALNGLILHGALVVSVATVTLLLSRYLIASVSQRVVERLRNSEVQRLLTLEVPQLVELASGDLLARVVGDATALSGFFGAIARRVVRDGIVVVGSLTMLFVLDWRLALMICTLVPLTGLLLSRLGAVVRRWGGSARRTTGTLGALLNEQLHGFATIKGFQAEAFELARFRTQNASVRRELLRTELWSAVLVASIFVSTGVGLVATVWYGTSQLASGAISAGALLAFCLFAGQVVEPLRRLSEIQSTLQGQVVTAASRVYEIIDLPGAAPSCGLRLAPPSGGRLSLERVSFGYRRGESVLRQVSVTIAPRERVALVGTTGAGKSTLASLLVRFHVPSVGRISLDGRDLADYSVDGLRRAICLLQQEPFLFSGPLIGNLRYGSWYAPREAVAGAVRLTRLETLVGRLPCGLDTPLREAGRQLSGGEKQRIALVRAILRDPGVLILDEATSAMDGETEAAIYGRLEAWLRQRTVIAIGHRLSTISRFPRVIVLDQGQIVGDGSVDDLVVSCPAFRGLFADQLEALARHSVRGTG